MIVEVRHPVYGKTELERVIAICPDYGQLFFENTVCSLRTEDFNKVAELWRKRFQ